MKKIYMTPVINIENFEMDIDILRGITQADLDFARIDFEMTFADDIAGMTDEQIEAIWTMKYLPILSGQYDNVSSGLCYHSTGGLS